MPATLITDANWDGDEPSALAQGLLQSGVAVLIVAPFLTDGTEREGHGRNGSSVPHVQSSDDGLPGAGHSHGFWPIWTSTCAWASATSSARARPASGAYLRGRWLVMSAVLRWIGAVAI